jgi:hypothetical protein
MKRQKNMTFVTFLFVTGTWKDAILKCGIVLQIEIQNRKKEGKEGKGESVKTENVFFSSHNQDRKTHK